MTTSTLYISQSSDALDLNSAIQSVFGTATVTALLYGAKAICIASGTADRFVCGRNIVDLTEFYQAEVFSGETTLTWRRTSGSKGSATILALSPTSLSSAWRSAAHLTDVFSIAQQHLLWGQPVHQPLEQAEGWTRLSAARIGALDVPLHVPENHKAVLQAKSWFRPNPAACGNPQYIGRTWDGLGVIPMSVKRGT